MLTTNQKGAIAETAIAHEAIKLGIGVYRPYIDERVDFVFDWGGRLIRVQCKWATLHGDVVIARLYSSRRSASGMVNRRYSIDEVDGFAVYCDETRRCYFLEASEFAKQRFVYLRLRGTRNNQAARINWARDYEFGAKLILLPGP